LQRLSQLQGDVSVLEARLAEVLVQTRNRDRQGQTDTGRHRQTAPERYTETETVLGEPRQAEGIRERVLEASRGSDTTAAVERAQREQAGGPASAPTAGDSRIRR
jgi:hypothetical protein